MSATKAEERKALEKIKNIVNELGEDSYVGAAFEGCFDIAEQNIDNDWMGSLSDSLKRLVDKNGELKSEIRKLNGSIKEYEKAYKASEDWLEHFKTRYFDIKKMHEEVYKDKLTLETKAKELEQENIKLKARLYDLMMEDKKDD